MSVINSEVIDELEKEYNNLKFKEPEIDIQEDLLRYISSLKYVEEHDREDRMISWIRSKINPILTTWEKRYTATTMLLTKVATEISAFTGLKGKETINIHNTQSLIRAKEEEKIIKMNDINAQKTLIVKTELINLDFEKSKATTLLFFSFLIAIGTYIYFMHAQIDIKWSTVSKSEKVAQVKEMLLDGAINQYSAFDKFIPMDNNGNIIPPDKLKFQDLAEITEDNIYLAPTPTLFQYILYDFSVISLAFVSFILIIFGLVTSTIYQKLGYPKWMLILIWILTAMVLSGAVYSISSLGEKKIIQTRIIDDIRKYHLEIKKIEIINGGFFGTDNGTIGSPKQIKNPKIVELEKKMEDKERDLTEIVDSMGSFKFITMFLFLFAEVLVGSLGWIAKVEYIKKEMEFKHSGQDVLEQLQKEFKYIEDEIEGLNKSIQTSQDKIMEATRLEHRLVALRGKLFSPSDIHTIGQQHLEREIANGQLILQEKINLWREEKDNDK